MLAFLYAYNVIARPLLVPLSQFVMRQPGPACVLTGCEADADVANWRYYTHTCRIRVVQQ